MNRAARVLAWWRDPRQWSALALVVVLLLALPPLRALLEASMSSHMLVQMPLLAAAGFIGTRGLPAARRDRLYRLSGGALPLVLMTMVASSYWMLPRALDAALADPWAELAKFASLPLLAGAPLALAWQRFGPIARGFLWTNVVSMLAVHGRAGAGVQQLPGFGAVRRRPVDGGHRPGRLPGLVGGVDGRAAQGCAGRGRRHRSGAPAADHAAAAALSVPASRLPSRCPGHCAGSISASVDVAVATTARSSSRSSRACVKASCLPRRSTSPTAM